ncbi:MAG: fluoride efflux transporter CrcB [Anaerofustis sp.]
MQLVYVGLGGAVGAIMRYMVSLVFSASNSPFPFITLLINFIGAFVIGLLSEYSGQIMPIDPKALLFLSTGLCGGFTTFSTFSLETSNLLSGGKFGLAALYATLSVLLCLLGIFFAKFIVSELAAH